MLAMCLLVVLCVALVTLTALAVLVAYVVFHVLVSALVLVDGDVVATYLLGKVTVAGRVSWFTDVWVSGQMG